MLHVSASQRSCAWCVHLRNSPPRPALTRASLTNVQTTVQPLLPEQVVWTLGRRAGWRSCLWCRHRLGWSVLSHSGTGFILTAVQDSDVSPRSADRDDLRRAGGWMKGGGEGAGRGEVRHVVATDRQIQWHSLLFPAVRICIPDLRKNTRHFLEVPQQHKEVMKSNASIWWTKSFIHSVPITFFEVFEHTYEMVWNYRTPGIFAKKMESKINVCALKRSTLVWHASSYCQVESFQFPNLKWKYYI